MATLRIAGLHPPQPCTNNILSELDRQQFQNWIIQWHKEEDFQNWARRIAQWHTVAVAVGSGIGQGNARA